MEEQQLEEQSAGQNKTVREEGKSTQKENDSDIVKDALKISLHISENLRQKQFCVRQNTAHCYVTQNKIQQSMCQNSIKFKIQIPLKR